MIPVGATLPTGQIWNPSGMPLNGLVLSHLTVARLLKFGWLFDRFPKRDYKLSVQLRAPRLNSKRRHTIVRRFRTLCLGPKSLRPFNQNKYKTPRVQSLHHRDILCADETTGTPPLRILTHPSSARVTSSSLQDPIPARPTCEELHSAPTRALLAVLGVRTLGWMFVLLGAWRIWMEVIE